MTIPLKIVFYCSANSFSGFGHVSRCISLAREIREVRKDAEISFIGNYEDFPQQIIRYYYFKCVNISLSKFKDVQNLSHWVTDCDIIILDSYLFDDLFLTAVSSWKSPKKIVIDDFHSFSYNDFEAVINFTVDADSNNYLAKRKYLGLQYFIAKPEMKDIREKNLSIKKSSGFENVMVFLGGAFNDGNFFLSQLLMKLHEFSSSIKMVKVISHIPGGSVSIIKNPFTIEFQKPSVGIEKLYSEADICICGGGLTKYESAYCNVPPLVFSMTEDQFHETERFEKAGLCFNLGYASVDRADFRALNKIIANGYVSGEFTLNSRKKFETFSTVVLANSILN